MHPTSSQPLFPVGSWVRRGHVPLILALATCILAMHLWADEDAEEKAKPIVDLSRMALSEVESKQAEAIAFASPRVVSIISKSQVRRRTYDSIFEEFFGGVPAQRSVSHLGSGVVYSENGYIVTNRHVIEGATEVEVVFADGQRYAAAVRGKDKETDLAVIKIEASGLKPATWADSAKVVVGQKAIAIGNPFGLAHTATEGIISALDRSGIGVSRGEGFLQTSAAINPGNSGGALTDLRGFVVGINTSILSESGGNQGIGFAIPSNTVIRVAAELIEHVKIGKPYMGVLLESLTTRETTALGLDKGQGLYVSGVYRGSPAADVGIRPGDVLLKVDGAWVQGRDGVETFLAGKKIGDALLLDVYRSGRVLQFRLTLGDKE